MVLIEELDVSVEELKRQGNEAFKTGEFQSALDCYNKALNQLTNDSDEIRPAILFNRGTAMFHLENYEECISSCSDAIKLSPNYVKALYRRAKALEKVEKLSEAVADFDRVLELDPSMKQSCGDEYNKLVQRRDTKLEKEKAEMMSNLKDLGNKLLGNFGLSLDSFQLDQNESGSYSVQMKKPNPPS